MARLENDELLALFAELADLNGHPDSDVLRRLWEFLLITTGIQLPSADADDIAGTVLVALITRLRDHSEPIQHPVSYLYRSVRTASIAAAKRRVRSEPVDPLDLADIVGLGDGPIEPMETQDTLRRALDRAATAGDHQAVQVAIALLDLDDELQRVPSSREVAEFLHVSHTTVARMLSRLRLYVQGSGSEK